MRFALRTYTLLTKWHTWRVIGRVFIGYVGMVAIFWGFAEAFTYFTESKLRDLLGGVWWIVFYVVPLLISVVGTYLSAFGHDEKDKARRKAALDSVISVI